MESPEFEKGPQAAGEGERVAGQEAGGAGEEEGIYQEGGGIEGEGGGVVQEEALLSCLPAISAEYEEFFPNPSSDTEQDVRGTPCDSFLGEQWSRSLLIEDSPYRGPATPPQSSDGWFEPAPTSSPASSVDCEEANNIRNWFLDIEQDVRGEGVNYSTYSLISEVANKIRPPANN